MELYELSFNIAAMKFSGYVLPGVTNPNKCHIFWFILTLIPGSIMNILNFINFFLSPFDFTITVQAAFQAINGAQAHIKKLYFIFMYQQIKSLLLNIEEVPQLESELFSKQYRGMRKISRSNLRRFSYVNFAYYFLATAFTMVLPATARLLTQTETEKLSTGETPRQLLFEIWWPSDPHSEPTYYVIMLWQSFMAISYTISSCVSDTFVCAMILSVAERGSLLARYANVALIPGPGGRVTKRAKSWIKTHQRYLRIIKQISEVMGPFILVANLCAILNLISSAFFIMKIDDKAILAFYFVQTPGVLIRIFIFSYVGQHVIDVSTDLSKAVASACHTAQCHEDKRTTLATKCSLGKIVLSKCCGEKHDEINAMGFYTVSMDLFSTVLSASFSYFLFLWQIQPKRTNMEENLKL